jgi:hypothetical protein
MDMSDGHFLAAGNLDLNIFDDYILYAALVTYPAPWLPFNREIHDRKLQHVECGASLAKWDPFSKEIFFFTRKSHQWEKNILLLSCQVCYIVFICDHLHFLFFSFLLSCQFKLLLPFYFFPPLIKSSPNTPFNSSLHCQSWFPLVYLRSCSYIVLSLNLLTYESWWMKRVESMTHEEKEKK